MEIERLMGKKFLNKRYQSYCSSIVSMAEKRWDKNRFIPEVSKAINNNEKFKVSMIFGALVYNNHKVVNLMIEDHFKFTFSDKVIFYAKETVCAYIIMLESKQLKDTKTFIENNPLKTCAILYCCQWYKPEQLLYIARTFKISSTKLQIYSIAMKHALGHERD